MFQPSLAELQSITGLSAGGVIIASMFIKDLYNKNKDRQKDDKEYKEAMTLEIASIRCNISNCQTKELCTVHHHNIDQRLTDISEQIKTQNGKLDTLLERPH